MDLPEDETCYYFHKAIVENREEDVAPFSKPMRIVKKEREYKHDSMVFKDWKVDTPIILDKCWEHDSKYWKLTRIIKDPEIQEAVKSVMRRIFPKLKNIFHYLIAKSSFPCIGWLDYSNWATSVKVVDGDPKIPQATVDRAFTAANFEMEKVEGNMNPAEALQRFEFLEIVVRLAKAKYLETGMTKTFADAVNMLYLQNIQKYDRISEEWNGWRNKHLYTIQVSDLMEPNLPGLKKLYESFYDPRKKCMD